MGHSPVEGHTFKRIRPPHIVLDKFLKGKTNRDRERIVDLGGITVGDNMITIYCIEILK